MLILEEQHTPPAQQNRQIPQHRIPLLLRQCQNLLQPHLRRELVPQRRGKFDTFVGVDRTGVFERLRDEVGREEGGLDERRGFEDRVEVGGAKDGGGHRSCCSRRCLSVWSAWVKGRKQKAAQQRGEGSKTSTTNRGRIRTLARRERESGRAALSVDGTPASMLGKAVESELQRGEEGRKWEKEEKERGVIFSLFLAVEVQRLFDCCSGRHARRLLCRRYHLEQQRRRTSMFPSFSSFLAVFLSRRR
jgi:hypothetical protein